MAKNAVTGMDYTLRLYSVVAIVAVAVSPCQAQNYGGYNGNYGNTVDNTPTLLGCLTGGILVLLILACCWAWLFGRRVARSAPAQFRTGTGGPIRSQEAGAAAAEEEEASKKPPADVRVVIHPDNGIACAVWLSMAYQLQTAASLASAFSERLTPANSSKLDTSGASFTEASAGKSAAPRATSFSVAGTQRAVSGSLAAAGRALSGALTRASSAARPGHIAIDMPRRRSLGVRASSGSMRSTQTAQLRHADSREMQPLNSATAGEVTTLSIDTGRRASSRPLHTSTLAGTPTAAATAAAEGQQRVAASGMLRSRSGTTRAERLNSLLVPQPDNAAPSEVQMVEAVEAPDGSLVLTGLSPAAPSSPHSGLASAVATSPRVALSAASSGLASPSRTTGTLRRKFSGTSAAVGGMTSSAVSDNQRQQAAQQPPAAAAAPWVSPFANATFWPRFGDESPRARQSSEHRAPHGDDAV